MNLKNLKDLKKNKHNYKINLKKNKRSYKARLITSNFFYRYTLLNKLIKIRNNKYLDLFIKKIFFILIYTGKKIKVINIFLNWIKFLKFLFVKKYKTVSKLSKRKRMYFSFYKYLFINRIYKIICPKLNSENFFKKGVLSKLPSLTKSNYKDKVKIFTTVSLWIKKSVENRKEKTFVLKFYSELFDINLKKGNSYKQKIEYYKIFYQNKKFYKFKKWT